MGRLSSSTKFPYAKGLLPQEEKLEIGKQTQRLVIGIPAEADKTESRIPLTPEAVEILVNQGHQIIIEKDAGKKANYTDHQYSEKGRDCSNRRRVYKSQIVQNCTATSR